MWLRYRIMRPPAILLSKLPVYRLRWSGEDNVPVSGPFIIVSNHQTSVDGLGIAIALKKTAKRSEILPWAKKEIKKGKDGIIGAILWRIFSKIPIDRGAEGEAPKAIKKSLDLLRKRKIVMVFPEGTRYPAGEVGTFKYGVANLARATPAPILPVGVYRREEDNGVQVNIGRPFFMPAIPPEEENLERPRGRVEALIINQLQIAQEWGESVGHDKKVMRLLASMIDLVISTIDKQQADFHMLFQMGRPQDNELLRDKVMELLPDDWRAVQGPSTRKKSRRKRLFPA